MRAWVLAFVLASASLAFLEYRMVPRPSLALFSMVSTTTKHAPPVVVVVGSGLAGTTAAISAAEASPDSEVVVLEKEQGTGGNSNKASSGMNALTPEQGDSVEAFTSDTLKSGGGLSNPALVDSLVVSVWLELALCVCCHAHAADSAWTTERLPAPRVHCAAYCLLPWPGRG